ncbi:MAG TPA: nitroreductase family protein [Actinomycetaceae bacterium]|nr:nitroreductase family protein [Actinomycetaceae bacterium]
MRDPVLIWHEFLLDARSYSKSAAAHRGQATADSLEARLTMDYHKIEKSLTLPEPRRPFGLTVEQRMKSLMSAAGEQDREKAYFAYSSDALTALAAWNSEGNVDARVAPQYVSTFAGLVPETAELFFASRRSTRNFDLAHPPDPAVVLHAARLAGHSPSVCNRQASCLHLFHDRETVRQLLAHQRGNAGFGPTIPMLGIVTVRRGLFVGPGERNQRWVDGGLFAMTFVWALHALGVQSCMLNWSMPNRATAALRRTAGIDDGEDVIVLVAIGHRTGGSRVARSERRPAADFITLT